MNTIISTEPPRQGTKQTKEEEEGPSTPECGQRQIMDLLNRSAEDVPKLLAGRGSPSKIMLSLILSVLAVSTTAINSLVITAILITRKLHQPANYLICSLAVTDLLVAVLVMPISIVYIIEEVWLLGPVLCHMWLGIDVICCTCSIMHLAAIALDRYCAITNAVEYSQKRTARRAAVTITAVWVLSVLVSLPLLIWRRQPEPTEEGVMDCWIEHDHVAFTVYSTLGAFYIPLTLILVLYYKIYKAAQTLRNRRGSSRVMGDTVSSIMLHGEGSDKDGPLSPCTLSPTEKSFSDLSLECDRVQIANQNTRSQKGRRTYATRERRAALTLGLILGAFVICWLPFFLKEVIVNACPTCSTSVGLADGLTWLGYLNSLINPLIYTIFNEDFKKAFLKLLPFHCSHHKANT
ncbi:5-hydroxytryptamine receptor 1F [Denticeps clupeoides]|uniref:G-protein coupled receptors family 1 profile domain-containing protein n=1 Tax=Denticeps clupeoides TaxID=299321 RepID=A0AAY4BQH5_9TELE|nr:5-hydroxytryptamine receptor 1F-like [Denticeps clupeoides]